MIYILHISLDFKRSEGGREGTGDLKAGLTIKGWKDGERVIDRRRTWGTWRKRYYGEPEKSCWDGEGLVKRRRTVGLEKDCWDGEGSTV